MSVLAVATRPTDGATEDRDLVAGVRAGDDRAFELLFARYQPRITAYVRGFVHDDGRAEDVTQEVFIAALRRLREEPGREIHFKPWIYEVAKNKCIDAFRRTRNTSEISLDTHDALLAEEQGRLSEPGATPDSQVEDKVALDNLRGAFGGLSQVHHEILVMREFEGLTYREIGERLGMSNAAVESTLFRARKRLTEEYEELVSGERCLRVQRLVDEFGGRPAGVRDRRRMARHLAHCQPCRRHACRAGVDLGAVVRPPAAAAAKIAAFLPLPAFLRRRWGADDATAPLLGHGGTVSQWSAHAVAALDPGVMSNWTKVVATAATVAVAGMGAGAAITERAPFGGGAEKPRSAPALSGAGAQAAAARRQAREGAGRSGAQGDIKPAGAASSPSSERSGAGPAIAAGRAGSTAATQDAARAGRRFDSHGGALPPAAAAPGKRSEADSPRQSSSLGKIIAGDRDPGTAAAGAAGTGTPDLLGGLGSAGATPGGEAGGSLGQVPDAAAGLAPAATPGTDSVTSPASETVATTTAVNSLGG